MAVFRTCPGCEFVNRSWARPAKRVRIPAGVGSPVPPLSLSSVCAEVFPAGEPRSIRPGPGRPQQSAGFGGRHLVLEKELPRGCQQILRAGEERTCFPQRDGQGPATSGSPRARGQRGEPGPRALQHKPGGVQGNLPLAMRAGRLPGFWGLRPTEFSWKAHTGSPSHFSVNQLVI